MTRRYPDLDALRKNISPDVRIVDDASHAHPAPYRLTPADAPEHPAPANEMAARFEALWRRWDGAPLAREHRFHVRRKWRFDYWHAPTQTAIELEGGIYSAGRHTRATGYLGDLEKYNAAAMQGITVLRLGTGQVDDAHVAEIADYVRRKMRASHP